MSLRVPAPVARPPTFLACLLSSGISSRPAAGLQDLVVNWKAGEGDRAWEVSTHSGAFICSLQWRWPRRRTSLGAPSSGGRGSSLVCTWALKAKGTAGHDGNAPCGVCSSCHCCSRQIPTLGRALCRFRRWVPSDPRPHSRHLHVSCHSLSSLSTEADLTWSQHGILQS